MKKIFLVFCLSFLAACSPAGPVEKPTSSQSQKDCNLAECNCGEECACSSACPCSSN